MSTTTKDDRVITSLGFGATPTTVSRECSSKWSQACYHYSSAIVQNPAWDSLPCVHGNVKAPGKSERPGVAEWYTAHDESWREPADRGMGKCDADEYPPRYLLTMNSPEMVNAGMPGGQSIRYLPARENQDAGRALFTGACFVPLIKNMDMTPKEFLAEWNASPVSKRTTHSQLGVISQRTEIAVDVKPYFKISPFEHAANPPIDAGLWENTCWPKLLAPDDPGFALFSFDPWYIANSPNPKWDFKQKYQKGSNGS
ncbi:hypothetical protein IMZ48_19185 [Candidatus Bathyarchaeota archaeon]|nr:hypothetical protein [Candidatus Bathyarchaeota archaeon]